MDLIGIYGTIFGILMIVAGTKSEIVLIITMLVMATIFFGVAIHTSIKNKPIQQEIDRLKRLRDEIGALPKEGKDSVQRAKETAEWLRITMQINELENKLEELK